MFYFSEEPNCRKNKHVVSRLGRRSNIPGTPTYQTCDLRGACQGPIRQRGLRSRAPRGPPPGPGPLAASLCSQNQPARPRHRTRHPCTGAAWHEKGGGHGGTPQERTEAEGGRRLSAPAACAPLPQGERTRPAPQQSKGNAGLKNEETSCAKRQVSKACSLVTTTVNTAGTHCCSPREQPPGSERGRRHRAARLGARGTRTARDPHARDPQGAGPSGRGNRMARDPHDAGPARTRDPQGAGPTRANCGRAFGELERCVGSVRPRRCVLTRVIYGMLR